MHLRFLSPAHLAAALLLALTLPAPAAHPLPRSTPEAQGISSRNILDFVDAPSFLIDSVITQAE